MIAGLPCIESDGIQCLWCVAAKGIFIETVPLMVGFARQRLPASLAAGDAIRRMPDFKPGTGCCAIFSNYTQYVQHITNYA
jgi:hypothetical protein